MKGEVDGSFQMVMESLFEGYILGWSLCIGELGGLALPSIFARANIPYVSRPSLFTTD